MSTIIERDMLTATSGVLMHQCNCQGSMGSGIAKSIKDKWPGVAKAYVALVDEYKRQGSKILGQVQVGKVGNDLYIANVFGQEYYGNRPKWVYTSYKAVDQALKQLKELIEEEGLSTLPVFAPYHMGCNRAGGDWSIYKAIIEKYFPDVVYCKWRG